jgi:hypothetical protein
MLIAFEQPFLKAIMRSHDFHARQIELVAGRHS